MGLTRRERKERRAQRRDEWAEGREQKATASFAQVKQTADAIPLGQPILVGHHSEKRARRDQKRIRGGVRRGLDHQKIAKRHRSKAAGIRDQLDRSIFSDDHDAAERLRERIAERETKRDRMKAVNRIMARVGRAHGFKRRTGLYPHNLTEAQAKKAGSVLMEVFKEAEATKAEIADLVSAWQHSGTLGYPGYALSNLGANIRRDRARLPAAEKVEEQRRKVREALEAELAEAEKAAEAAEAEDAAEAVCDRCGNTGPTRETVVHGRHGLQTVQVCPPCDEGPSWQPDAPE